MIEPYTGAALTYGLPFADYLALPGAHFSTLKALDVSPLHYRHACDVERADTPSLRLGRLTHALVLAPHDEAVPGLAIYEGAVKRGKAWEMFAAAHEGEEIVRRDELDAALAMRRAVHANPYAARLLSDGEPEVTCTWQHPSGLPLRCRFDWLLTGRPTAARGGWGFVELKTTRLAGLDAFAREAASRRYHAQAALYAAGYEAAFGCAPESVHMIAVQSAPPWDVVVYEVPGEALDAGRALVEGWIARVGECERMGVWPGAAGGEVQRLTLPAWAMGELPDVDLGGIGEV